MFDSVISGLLGLLIAFSGLARGAHDLWAATVVHLCAVFLTAALLLHESLQKRSPGLRWPLAGLALLFAAALAISWKLSVNPSESLIALEDWVSAILLLYCALNTLQNERSLALLTAMVVPVFWIQAVTSLSQTSWSGVHFAMTGRLWLGLSENPGTLVNANIQAAFLLFWFPVLLSLFTAAWTSRGGLRWYWLSGLIGAFVSFAAAWSTLGWAVLVFTVAVWSRTGDFFKKRSGRAVLAVLILLVVLKFVPAIFRETSLFRSPWNRLAWWGAALKMAADKPWFGIGIGNFPSAFLAYKTGMGENTLYAHSLFFEMLSETGFVGLLALGFFSVKMIGLLRKTDPHSDVRRSFAVGSAAAAAFCLVSLGMEYLVNLLCLGIFVGAASATATSAVRKTRVSVALLFMGVSIFSIPYLIAPFMASRLMVTGRSLTASGAWDPAQQAFEASLKIDPSSWESASGLAQMSFQRFFATRDTSYLEQAVTYQRRAVELNKLNGMLWWDLGKYCEAVGKTAEAHEYFEKAVRTHPGLWAIENHKSTF